MAIAPKPQDQWVGEVYLKREGATKERKMPYMLEIETVTIAAVVLGLLFAAQVAGSCSVTVTDDRNPVIPSSSGTPAGNRLSRNRQPPLHAMLT